MRASERAPFTRLQKCSSANTFGGGGGCDRLRGISRASSQIGKLTFKDKFLTKSAKIFNCFSAALSRTMQLHFVGAHFN